MTLEQILAVASENNKIVVYDFISWETLAVYDGKNSVPLEMNGETVKHIRATNNTLYIGI